MEKKSFGYRGYTKSRNKNFTKDGKLACLRQMSGNVSSENTETVQDENQGRVVSDKISFKVSRLEKVRVYREEKDLKRKLQLKSKRPPFKPLGTSEPRSVETSPMGGQIKAPKPSFIPRMGTLKPPSVFVKKRAPKETKQPGDLKPLLKKVSSAIKSRDKKEPTVQFESLSPGFPSDISCIEPVSKKGSFAPIEFTFSGIENIEQFDFLPVADQSLPESVTRRSTPVSSEPASSSFKPKKNTAMNASPSKRSSIKPRSVLLETTNILSTSQSTANKSNNSGRIKAKLDPIKQYPLTRNAAEINSSNSMSKTLKLSSSLPRNEKGKVPGKNQPGTTANKQDKYCSLPVSSKARQWDSGKNSRGSLIRKKDPVRVPPAISARILLQGKGNASESFCKNINSIKEKASRDIYHHSSFKNRSNEASFEQKKSGSKVTRKLAEGSKKAAKGVKDDDKKAIAKQNLCQGEADIKVLIHSIPYEKHGDVSNKTVIKFSSLNGNSAKADECKTVINSHALEDDDKPMMKPSLIAKEESITMMKPYSFEENGGNTTVIKSSSLGKNKENNQTVIKSISLQNYESEKTLLKSISFESNKMVIIKPIPPQENENECGSNTMIIKYSSHPDDENDKSLTKSLPFEENEKRIIKFPFHEKIENEDKVVIKSVLLEQQNDDEKVSVRFVLGDGDPIIQPILFLNENCEEASPASFDGSILTDHDFLKSNVLEGSKDDVLLSSFLKENATFDEGITKVIDSSKMTTMSGSSREFKLKNNTILLQKPCNICEKHVCHCVYDTTPSPTKGIATPAPAKEIAIPAPIKAITTPAPIKAITTPAPIKAITTPAPIKAITTPAPIKAITTPAPIKAITTPASTKAITTPASTKAIAPLNKLTIVSSQYNFLKNSSKESIMQNSATDSAKAKELNQEFFSKSNSGVSNQTLSSSRTSATEEQLPQQKDYLSESNDEVVLKSTNDVAGNSCEDSVATAIPSVIDEVSEPGLSRKLCPLLNQSLLFSDRTASSSKRIPKTNKIMKSVRFSRQMSEVSFIDDEIMPEINLEGLDNTLDISTWSDICNTPRICRGIKFFHFQEMDIPKIGFSSCIKAAEVGSIASEESSKLVSPSTSELFDLLTNSEMEAGKSYLDLSVSSKTDVMLPSASKEMELLDVGCASKEMEIIDIGCASKEMEIIDIGCASKEMEIIDIGCASKEAEIVDIGCASKEAEIVDVGCACKEAEIVDIGCASKETEILDIERADKITCKTSVIDETTSGENDVSLFSISLLGSPQVPKTPRRPLPENLIAFSPFIKF